mgnify:CR=1 FL=1
MFNSPEDRALSEHEGSALFVKKASGKYSLFLPVTGTGENGSAPESLDKTVVGNKQKSYVEGRTDNPQKSIPFYTHRDNITILEENKGKVLDFLRVLPDFTAMKYSGTVNYKLNNTDVGSLEQGEMTITPTTGDTYVENCYALIEDTAIFTNDIPNKVVVAKEGTAKVNTTTNPADATVTVVQETGGNSYATATYETGVVTITGVAKGQTIIRLKVSKTGYADFVRSILVIVTE